MKILITGAHGDIACSVAKIIKSEFNKFEIYGTDSENEGPGDYLFKKIYKIPNSHNEYFLIVECCIKAGRLAEALVLSHYGSPNLWESTSKSFFKNHKQVCKFKK